MIVDFEISSIYMALKLHKTQQDLEPEPYTNVQPFGFKIMIE